MTPPRVLKANTAPSASAGEEWISVALEGEEEKIKGFIASTDFSTTIGRVLEEGIGLGLPVMVGGYPTFVSHVGNGLTVREDCDNEAYETYSQTALVETQALFRFSMDRERWTLTRNDSFFKAEPGLV